MAEVSAELRPKGPEVKEAKSVKEEEEFASLVKELRVSDLSRETDSDSDSYEEKVKGRDYRSQKAVANALRSILTHLTQWWDEKECPVICEKVRNLVAKPSGLTERLEILRTCRKVQELTRGKRPYTLSCRDNRLRHAAASILHALKGHVKFTKKGVEHKELVLKLLSILEGKSKELKAEEANQISLFAYWDNNAMGWLKQGMDLLELSDEDYAKKVTDL